jgi:CheY-like chemotaxis protein
MNPPAPPKTSSNEQNRPHALTGRRIYILDDETDPITILETNLSRCGAETRSFSRPGPAFASIKKSPPDLLLLDIMMPEMDGWEFYSSLRDDPELRRLPVLFVTCLSEHDIEAEMEQDGLCATLSKPVFRDQLIEKVAQLLAASPNA